MSANEKTEQPTSRRLSEARKKGQVAKSSDLNTALVLGGIALLLTVYGAYFVQYLSRLMREMLWHQLQLGKSFTVLTLQDLFREMVFHSVIVVTPFLFGALLIGVAANLMQVQFLFTMDPLKPNLEKINPLSGIKRLCSQRAIMELVKGIIKMGIVGWCGFSVIQSNYSKLMSMSSMSFGQAWLLIFQIVLNICSTSAMVLLVLGVADWIYQKRQLTKQLKMTRQEVKDEMKNTEGNPEVKGKIRSAGQALVQKRMLKAVETADVIITNPTHFAVAIQYDPDIAPAPRVVAKGVDHFAMRIREAATQHGVPIQENKPLARSLYAMVEVDHMIPPELFVAVAETLAYVFKRNRGRRRNPHVSRLSNALNGGGGTR